MTGDEVDIDRLEEIGAAGCLLNRTGISLGCEGPAKAKAEFGSTLVMAIIVCL